MGDTKDACTTTLRDEKAPSPGKLKQLFVMLYSPKGELSRWEYVKCFVLFFITRFISTLLFVMAGVALAFIAEGEERKNSLVLLGLLEAVLDIFTLIYPYTNIATKRLRYIGMRLKFSFLYVLLVVILFSVIMYFNRYDYLGYILYSIPAICLFFTWRGR